MAFLSRIVQTVSGAHPATYSMDKGVPRRWQSDVDHWLPTSARLSMSGAIHPLSLFSRISPPIKSKKRNIYIKAAIVISSYKSQQIIRNLNDYLLNASHHGKSTLTIQRTPHPQKVTTRYQRQIFEPTCKAILLLRLILNMFLFFLPRCHHMFL